MSRLAYGLNVTKKPQGPLVSAKQGVKKTTVFDNEDEDDLSEEDLSAAGKAQSIQIFGGLQSRQGAPESSPMSKPKAQNKVGGLTKKPRALPAQTFASSLSANHASNKHSKTAQEIDPSIYDYDAAFDAMHAVPSSNVNIIDEQARKPKYMEKLLLAAETRKRDQVRAKEKLLAREREAEGDEFKDKEQFVTAAYKRQQEEIRKMEAEEGQKEKEAELRRKREGGGMKAFHSDLLNKNERRHQELIMAIEAGKGTKLAHNETPQQSHAQLEADLAKKKGALTNEEGQIVDKRQLLSAGLNAGSNDSARVKSKGGDRTHVSRSKPGPFRDDFSARSSRERDSRSSTSQILGKRMPATSGSRDESRESRASKSRKMEDELLASLGLS